MPDQFLISQKIVQTDLELHKTIYQSGCELATHFHDEPRFVVVLRGTFHERSPMGARVCRSSTLIYRPAGEKHSNKFHTNPTTCISMKLGTGWLERFEGSSAVWNQAMYCDDSQISGLAHRLEHEMVDCDPVSQLAIETIILELGVHALRLKNRSVPASREKWMNQLMDLIHNQFFEPVTVKQIAAEVDVHPVYLIRAFRKLHGCTPADYIRNLRVRHASDLMLSTDRSLVEIAQSSGFCDQSHFSRLFKRVTGKSPAKYRLHRKSSG